MTSHAAKFPLTDEGKFERGSYYNEYSSNYGENVYSVPDPTTKGVTGIHREVKFVIQHPSVGNTSMAWQGYIKIDVAGTYYFLLESDDGSFATIAGQTFGNTERHPLNAATMSLDLEAGFHSITVKQFDRLPGGDNARAVFLRWGAAPNVPIVLGDYKARTPDSTPSTSPIVPLFIPKAHLELSKKVLRVGESCTAYVVDAVANKTYTLSQNPTQYTSFTPSGASLQWTITATDNLEYIEEIKEGVDVNFSLYESGTSGAIDNKTLRVEDATAKAADECECECTDGSCDKAAKMKSGCVSFEQGFGMSPWRAGASTGKIYIQEERPFARLFTPEAIRYKHVMMRKIVLDEDGYIIISDGSCQNIEYKDGYANGYNISNDDQIQKIDNVWVEKFADRTQIAYDLNGSFASLTTAEGVTITKAQFGIEVIYDNNGFIRQIYSICDGLIDVVTVDSTHYTLKWYKIADVGAKSGGLYTISSTANPIKQFVFGKVSGTTDNKNFELTEIRDAVHTYYYRWTYVDTNHEWTYVRGTGSDAVTQAKSLTKSNDVYTATTVTSASGRPSITEIELIGAGDLGNKRLERTINGETQGRSTRVMTGFGLGKTESMTSRYGDTISYSYDAYGRLSRTTRVGFAGKTEITNYTYINTPDANGFIDLRPRTIQHKIDDVVFKTTNYTYDDNASTGKSVTETETVGNISLTRITKHYPAGTSYNSGRIKSIRRSDGTMTIYAYSTTSVSSVPALNATFTETIDEGIESSGAFALIPGKSTRVVNTRNISGDIIKTERFVYIGTAWESLGFDTFEYNPMHRVVHSYFANGKESSAEWICTGPTTETDTDGIVTNYEYDSLKRLIGKSRLSPNGTRVESYTLDVYGRILSTTLSGGTGTSAVSETASQTYDGEGRILSRTDKAGVTFNFAYSPNARVTTETHPDGGEIITEVNVRGETVSISGSATTPQYYSYIFNAASALKVTQVNVGSATSKRWRKTYINGFGQTVKIEESGFDQSVRTSLNAFNAKGQLTQTSVTDQPTSAFMYDGFGNRIKTTLSDGTLSRYIETNTTFEKDANNILWQKTEDDFYCSDSTIEHIMTSQKTQLNNLSNALESNQFSYDARGKFTRQWNAFNDTSKVRTASQSQEGISNVATELSRDGQTQSQTDFAGVTQSFSYDAIGRQTSRTDGRNNTTTMTYNNKGQIVKVTDAAGNDVDYAYDTIMQRLASVTTYTVENNVTVPHVVSYEYDCKGQKTKESGSGTYPIDFVYNVFGEMIQHKTWRATPISTNADVTNWEYDESSGLLKKKTYADSNYWRYEYDVNGRLTRRIDSRGINTAYVYNTFGELTDVMYSDNTPNVENTFNALGQLISTTDASGTFTRTYTNYGEIAVETQSVLNATVELAYDAYGRETGTTLRRNNLVMSNFLQRYDANTGRIDRLSCGPYNFDYSYLAGTNLLNRMSTVGTLVEKLITYEANRDFPTEIKYQLTATGHDLIAKRNYTFDELGRVAARSQQRGTNPARNDSFGYNPRSELTSAELGNDNFGYSFDNIGNRLTAEELAAEIAYTSNELNQYTEISPESGIAFEPEYDLDGNQTKIKTSSGVWTVEYNAENRPVKFSHTSGMEIRCVYDAMGRRFEKKKYNADNTLAYHKRFSYRGYLQLAEFDVTTDAQDVETHTLVTTTIWDPTEPMATRPLMMFDEIAAKPYFYTHDLTKNICELLNDDATIAFAYDYTPFGALTTAQSATDPNHFTFSSEYLDSELALVYYNYRHYNPIDGRWLSRDPIHEKNSWNLYGIVNGRLIDEIDRIGLSSKGKCICGPDVTDWIDQEIAIIYNWYTTLAEEIEKWADAEAPWYEPDFVLVKAYNYSYLILLATQLTYYPSTSFVSANCPISEKCLNTVTYRGICMHSSEVGNIIYGAAARIFRMTKCQTKIGGIIGNRGERTDADTAAILFGWDYLNEAAPVLSHLSQIKSDAPDECLPCPETATNGHIVLPQITSTFNQKTIKEFRDETIIPK